MAKISSIFWNGIKQDLSIETSVPIQQGVLRKTPEEAIFYVLFFMFVSENLAISTLAYLNILGFYVIINH